MTDTPPEPYQVAYQAIVNLPAATGLPKVKRADVSAHAAVKALAYKGLLADEGQLRVMTAGHYTVERRTCPACGEALDRLAMVKLAYTFEPCDCRAAPYVHLVEQLWHREHVGGPLDVRDRRGT